MGKILPRLVTIALMLFGLFATMEGQNIADTITARAKDLIEQRRKLNPKDSLILQSKLTSLTRSYYLRQIDSLLANSPSISADADEFELFLIYAEGPNSHLYEDIFLIRHEYHTDYVYYYEYDVSERVLSCVGRSKSGHGRLLENVANFGNTEDDNIFLSVVFYRGRITSFELSNSFHLYPEYDTYLGIWGLIKETLIRCH